MKKIILYSIISIFTLVGILFTGVFIALQFNWLSVPGLITDRNSHITDALKLTNKESEMSAMMAQIVITCKIHALAAFAPKTAEAIHATYQKKQDIKLTQAMLATASIRFSETSLIKEFNQCAITPSDFHVSETQTAFAWTESSEWDVISSAFIRDQEIIRAAARDAGINPRILLGGIIGEQFRFFTSSRDSFKRYFEPLKILASMSKFSYGIAGLKAETVTRIEKNLHNPQSVFYLGQNYEQVIKYPLGTTDQEKVQFQRITDTKDPYYAYLYTGLFMRQVIAQWQNQGFDISNNPGVLATLFNLGFNRSIPKPDPKPGGAPITVNGTIYSFGDLAQQFFYSGELADIFPY